MDSAVLRTKVLTFKLLRGEIEIMSDGALFKPERDYTNEADKVIPEAQELAKVGFSDYSTKQILTISSMMYKKPSTRSSILKSKPDK